MPKFSFFAKDVRLFAFLAQDAENLVQMAGQLNDLFNVWQNTRQRAGIIAEMEQDGDAITHDIMRYLNKAFITPLDREDISAIANSLDDIADSIHAVADTAYLYGIETPTERSRELADIIVKAVREVNNGIADVNSTNHNPGLLKRCVTIHEIENRGDTVYHAALAELFLRPDDIFSIVKWREVYKKMEATIDNCESFADVLEEIAIKYT